MNNLSTNQNIPITRYGPEVANRKNVFVTIEVSDKIFLTHFLFCSEIAVNSPLVSCAFLNSMVVAGHFDCTARTYVCFKHHVQTDNLKMMSPRTWVSHIRYFTAPHGCEEMNNNRNLNSRFESRSAFPRFCVKLYRSSCPDL